MIDTTRFLPSSGERVWWRVRGRSTATPLAMSGVTTMKMISSTSTTSTEVFAIINPFGSGTNAAAVKRAVDAGVIYFSPWGASAVLQKISGNSPLLFTTIANYDTTTAAGLKWMIDEYKPQKVGFIFQEGPFGDLLGAGVKAAMEDKKMTLAATAGYKVGDLDFSSQVARMQAANVDLIVTATIIRETIGVAGEIKKIGMTNVKMLTGTPGRINLVAQLGKDAVEGIYGVGTSIRSSRERPGRSAEMGRDVQGPSTISSPTRPACWPTPTPTGS